MKNKKLLKVVIRDEKKADFETISALHTASFNHDLEAKLIIGLRKLESYKPSHSQVVELDNKVIGHAFLTPVDIANETDITKALVLGPVSISKDYQGQGLGTILVKKCLKVAKEENIPFVLVYGGDYYCRFGFKKAKYVFRPNPVFGHGMKIKKVISEASSSVRGVIHYPDPFVPLASEWSKK